MRPSAIRHGRSSATRRFGDAKTDCPPTRVRSRPDIPDDARRYLTTTSFDGRFEIGTALTRHEIIARKARNAHCRRTAGTRRAGHAWRFRQRQPERSYFRMSA
jgi:hypothetical protein